MSLENAGPSRSEVSEVLSSFPVGEQYAGLEIWLQENYADITVGAKTVKELILSDIESYSEYVAD